MDVDENKLRRDSAKADHAQRLLDDLLLKEAFEKLEKEYFEAWRNTGTAEAETNKRERLWQAINLLGKIKDELKKVIANGKVAKAHIAAIEGKRQRAA